MATNKSVLNYDQLLQTPGLSFNTGMANTTPQAIIKPQTPASSILSMGPQTNPSVLNVRQPTPAVQKPAISQFSAPAAPAAPAAPQPIVTPSGAQVTFDPQGAPVVSAPSFSIGTNNIPSDIFSGNTTMADVEKKRSQYEEALMAIREAQAYSPEYVNALKAANAVKARDAELKSNLMTGNNLPGDTMGYAQGFTSREAALNDIAGLRASQDLAVQEAIRSGNIEAAKATLSAYNPQPLGAGTSLVNPVTGELLVTAPTQSYAEYQDAVRSGYRGTFNDYQTADQNRKAAQLSASGLSPTQTQNFLRISDKYQADPFIANANKGATAIQIADQVLANPGGAGNQLKALYTLVKNLDPDSAVREGEVDLAQKTQSYFDKFATDLTRITNGQVVSPKTAVLLATATKELAQAWYETAQRRETQYISQAQIAGIGDPFGQYLGGFQRPYAAGGQQEYQQQYQSSGGYIDPSQATW